MRAALTVIDPRRRECRRESLVGGDEIDAHPEARRVTVALLPLRERRPLDP
jgi:hypothetical protein